MIIILNAASIGAQVEWEAVHRGEPELGLWLALQLFFCCAYVLELFLRVCGQGHNFFGVVDWRWNVFDVFVTVTSIVDLLISFLTEGTDAGALGAARMLRMVRVAKIIRVVRYLRYMRNMIFTLLHTLSSLAWSVVLMAMIMYLFAVAITEATTAYIVHNGGDSELAQKLLRYWGHIGSSIFTLLLSITSGVSWVEPASALSLLHELYVALFVMYVCFMVFAMMNVVTGFFCEHAFEMARSEKDSLIQEQLRRKHLYLEHFRQIFEEGDCDESGEISYTEFENFMQDEHLQAYLAHLNVDPDNAWQIFRLIDLNKDGSVSLEEFTTGLLTMKGPAKAIDVKGIVYDVKKESVKNKRRMKRIDAQLRSIRAQMAANSIHTTGSYN